MDSSKNFNYIIRKYPVFRAFLWFLLICLSVVLIYFLTFKRKSVPEIESIVPAVGSPGDVVLINGKNFGEIRDMSYVEIAGSKLTSSSYISWTDNCIKIVLPANVKDGLVYVGKKDVRSKPSLFANEVDIPVPVPVVQQNTKPVISSLSQEKVNAGDILVIYGNNFGESKNLSKVYFTVDYGEKISKSEIPNLALLTENVTAANEDEYDYVSWSNTEISVHVPDGAYTGVVYVDNGKEKSDPKNITVTEKIGKKSFLDKKTYLMQYSADIDDLAAQESATVTLRCPYPFTTVSQTNVNLTETKTAPVLSNYQNDIIYQITKTKGSPLKTVFSQSFVLDVYEVNTKIDAEKISQYKNLEKGISTVALKSDSLIPSDNEKIIALGKKITGREKNPYKQAKLVYQYMLRTYNLVNHLRTSEADPLDLLDSNSGDAYDFAVIYTAILRSLNIPCLTDSGILIAQDLTTQNHWWCEFYIENFGWIPVDVALGSGLDFKNWVNDEENSAEYYFGNLDSHHIIFSRGWNHLKPFSADNKIVQRPRSFALQSIWEESSSGVQKYSSYWSVPVIKGVY